MGDWVLNNIIVYLSAGMVITSWYHSNGWVNHVEIKVKCDLWRERSIPKAHTL